MKEEKIVIPRVRLHISITPEVNLRDLPKLNSSDKTAKLFYSHWEEIDTLESVYVLFLNKQLKPLCIKSFCCGFPSATIIPIPTIIKIGLLCNAQGIVLAHNHPSGELRPSEQDDNTTKNLKEAAKLFEIKVIDHLILTPSNNTDNIPYYSYASEGRLL